MERWNSYLQKQADNPAIDAFLADVVAVCKRHGMVLHHEDGHGSFEVHLMKGEPDEFHSLLNANDSTEPGQANCKHCQWWRKHVAAKPEERVHETFKFLHIEWDVTEAMKIITGTKSRKPQLLPVESLKGVVDYPREKGEGMDLLKVHVDLDHVKHVSTNRPIVVGYFPSDTSVMRGGKQVPADGVQAPRKHVVIDGHHRIARAIDLELDALPAWMLTPEESDWVCYVMGQRVGKKNPLNPPKKVRPRGRKLTDE